MTYVSVITPTIPERSEFLAECAASVAAQLLDDINLEHVVQVDEERRGCAWAMNRAADRAAGKWLLPLADDDLILPGCVQTLSLHVYDADIIYAPPLVTGNEDRWWFFQAPPVIPSFALIRASLWHDLGGYNEALRREEDRDLWIRALDAGATFKRVDEPCWVYRQHTSNKSFATAATV